MVKIANGTPVFISADITQEFQNTAQQLEDAITEKNKAFLISFVRLQILRVACILKKN